MQLAQSNEIASARDRVRPEAVSQGYVRKQTFVVHIVHETSSEAVQQLGHPFKLIEIENICRKSFMV